MRRSSLVPRLSQKKRLGLELRKAVWRPGNEASIEEHTKITTTFIVNYMLHGKRYKIIGLSSCIV